jgi:hypothetical protein
MQNFMIPSFQQINRMIRSSRMIWVDHLESGREGKFIGGFSGKARTNET